MGELKRGTTIISDVKRGATNINYIYRATTLIWQRSAPTAKEWSIETWSFASGVGPYSVIPTITTWDFTNGLGPNQKIY